MTSGPETFYSGYGTVDQCNQIFEKRVLEEIVVESKESVLKNISRFIEKEIKHVVEIDENKKNVWRRWIEHNQQSWGKILNVSGHTLVC